MIFRRGMPIASADAHEVPLDDLHGGATRYARHARHRRQPDGDHEQPELRADGRREDEREDDLRQREQDVHAPHEQVVELSASCRRR